MSAALEIKLTPTTALADTTRAKQRLFARVDYSREVPQAPDGFGTASSVAASAVEELNSMGQAKFVLADGVGDSAVEVRVGTAQGPVLSRDTSKFPSDGASKAVFAITLDDTVYSGQSTLQPSATAQRSGRPGGPAPGTNRGSTLATASAAVAAFASRTGALKFNVTRYQVATSLRALLSNVDSLDQGTINLCGPAAMLRTVLRRDPASVVDFVANLVEKGQAPWGPRLVKPCSDLRNQTFKTSWGVGAGQWVAMSSLRDDENWLLDFEGTPDESVSAATTPGEIEDWLSETGLYTSVRDEANLIFNEDKSHLLELTFDNNHDNLLLVHSHLLRNAPITGATPAGATAPATKKSDGFILRSFPNHWVVLASSPTESGGKVKMEVWSWGNIYSLDVPVATFEANYYGAVIANI